MSPTRLTRALALFIGAAAVAACLPAPPSNGTTPSTTDAPTTTAAPSTTTGPTTTAAPTTTTTTSPVVPNPTTPADAHLCNHLKQLATQNPARFNPSSTFNTPAACLGTREDSAKWAANWYRNATYPGRTDPSRRGEINVSFDAYSNPVYYTDEATTQIRVFISTWGWGHNLGSNNWIPWNPSWEPAAGNDMEMIILDRETGREWDLWGVQKINWTTCFTLENLLNGYRPGVDLCVATAHIGKNRDGSISDAVNSDGYSQSANRGLGAILGMTLLPTLDEIEGGSINHAVNMETYGTMFGPACRPDQIGTSAMGVDCGYAVAPASRLEWFTGPAAMCGAAAQKNTPEARAKTVPEGMRFALDVTDEHIDGWLDSRGYTGAKRRTARIFAVALRDYGWIISDTTCWDSAMAVEGIANPSARKRWEALGITNPTTDGASLLDGLITSESQVRTLVSPSSDIFVNSH